MGSEGNLSIPTINFSKENLIPGSAEWDSVRSQVLKAAEEYGCFFAFYDKVPLELQASLMEELKHLFDLPVESKMRYLLDRPYRGYIGKSTKDPYETISTDNPCDLDAVEDMCKIMWPQGRPNFSKTMTSYSEQVSKLDTMVRRMILESLGVEKYFEEHMNSAHLVLRMINYGSLGPDEEERPSLEAHTDNDIVTVISQNGVDGLEVKPKDGEWIRIQFPANCFIVFIGESLGAWTNGRVFSAPHRVTVTGRMDRISAGLFSIHKAGYIVKAPEEMVDEQHPLLYKPFDYTEFLDDLCGKCCDSPILPIKAYCGIREAVATAMKCELKD